jgi:tRNA-binding protein
MSKLQPRPWCARAVGCLAGAYNTRMATFDDFLKLDIRVGRIVAAEKFPAARKPAYKLTIDFGPEIGTKRSSAQIVARYPIDTLAGKLVLGVVNFPPRRIGPFESEVLTLGVPDLDGQVVLVGPDAPNAAVGAKLF